MDTRLGWLLALLAGALILLVVGARQVLQRADTPLPTAQAGPALTAPGPDAGVTVPPLLPPPPPPTPEAGPVEADAGPPPPAPTQDGGVGAESPQDALAREILERQRLEERLAELETAVDALTEEQDALLADLEAAEARLATLEAAADAVAEREAAEAPRFDRAALLEGVVEDLGGTLEALSRGDGEVSGTLLGARQALGRTADEAARLGRDLEVQRLEEADARLILAAEALARDDLYDARMAVAQAGRLTAAARDLARTAVAP